MMSIKSVIINVIFDEILSAVSDGAKIIIIIFSTEFTKTIDFYVYFTIDFNLLSYGHYRL